MKITQRQRVINYLKDKRDWVSGTELESQFRYWETKPSTISRRARELADEGKIERQLGFKRRVQYRSPSLSAKDANNFLRSL